MQNASQKAARGAQFHRTPDGFLYHTEAVLFSLLPFLRPESPRLGSVPPTQLVLPTHLSVVVRDMAETKGCSSTFTFYFIFIRQYKFCLRALRISQVGTLIT